MSSDSFSFHIISLLFNPGVELVCEVSHHLKVSVLESFKLVIDFLALVDCVLLVVFNFLVNVFELKFEPSFRIISQPHHFLEIPIHLSHLLSQTT